jgi:methionyl aminopeptidase
MHAGINTLHDGVTTGDIGSAVQAVLDFHKYGIVRELVGHGVGHSLHEDPDIPNYGKAGTGTTLKAGMTIAIEPMANLGSEKVVIDSDGWTIRTADGKPSAHFEHTILITDSGFEILTKL